MLPNAYRHLYNQCYLMHTAIYINNATQCIPAFGVYVVVAIATIASTAAEKPAVESIVAFK